MNELELWTNFKNGSEEDFTLLYRKYAPTMFRYGSKLSKDRELVKDAIQQIFFTLWKSKENISTPYSIKNYLLKSLRCEVIKKLTRGIAYETLPEEYSYEEATSFEADLIALQTSETNRERIASVLAQLPPRQREVIFLKYYSNLKYEEIAAVMGIGQQSVYKLTYKAIDKLHQLLAKVCVGLFSLYGLSEQIQNILY
ncbi:RNA polymerase sigma factor [Pontibacter pamirensis]|uniref:RNA polymerase sigma factor n=1 Tax=Pontibacter pamirensis TaxID=2562824 RepID=UPI001389D1E4|nr:sigma-70 family RNA polymerase sigma factor [Pontibacter pamirensis]